MHRNVLTELPSQPSQLGFVENTTARPSFQQQSPQSSQAALPRSQNSLSGLVTDIRDQDRGFLGWWYRLTCPEVSLEVSRSLEEREKDRKARLASLTLLVMCGFAVLPMPVALISNN